MVAARLGVWERRRDIGCLRAAFHLTGKVGVEGRVCMRVEGRVRVWGRGGSRVRGRACGSRWERVYVPMCSCGALER